MKHTGSPAESPPAARDPGAWHAHQNIAEATCSAVCTTAPRPNFWREFSRCKAVGVVRIRP
jgi:hypothetical protein